MVIDRMQMLKGFRAPETRMDAGFVRSGHRTLPSLLPSRKERFAGAGDGLGLTGGYSSASMVNDSGAL
jgi:hypothetical protein